MSIQRFQNQGYPGFELRRRIRFGTLESLYVNLYNLEIGKKYGMHLRSLGEQWLDDIGCMNEFK